MRDRPRIERTRAGHFRLRFPPAERELLRRLPRELRELLDEAPTDASLRRLFPPAYEEEADEAEYRELMHGELLEGRRRSLELLAATADRDRLGAEEVQAWLTAVNDLRLVLGTRLGVREETLVHDLDARDPRGHEVAVYAYLSWLQEQIVAAAADDL